MSLWGGGKGGSGGDWGPCPTPRRRRMLTFYRWPSLLVVNTHDLQEADRPLVVFFPLTITINLLKSYLSLANNHAICTLTTLEYVEGLAP